MCGARRAVAAHRTEQHWIFFLLPARRWKSFSLGLVCKWLVSILIELKVETSEGHEMLPWRISASAILMGDWDQQPFCLWFLYIHILNKLMLLWGCVWKRVSLWRSSYKRFLRELSLTWTYSFVLTCTKSTMPLKFSLVRLYWLWVWLSA